MIEINWNEVVTKAVTAVVVGVFASACVIVWRGATTVGDKVAKSEEKIVHLINGVSEALSSTRIEMQKEMLQLRIDMSNSVETIKIMGPPTFEQYQAEKEQVKRINDSFSVEQKALKAELLEKFQYKQ